MVFTRKDQVRLVAVVALLVAGVFVYKNNTPANETPPGNDSRLPIAITEGVDPQSVGKVVKDADGKEFLSNQIIVEFVAGVTEESALAIITEQKAVVVAHFTKAPVYLLQVEDAGDGSGAEKAILQFRKESQVKKADLNYLTLAPPPSAI